MEIYLQHILNTVLLAFVRINTLVEYSKRKDRHIPASTWELVYLATALDTACSASSPGSRRSTAVWISLEVMVDV